MARASSQGDVPLHPDTGVMVEPSRGLVLDPAGPIAGRRLVPLGRAPQEAHRCLHRHLQRGCRTLRLDQVQGPSAPRQRTTYQRTVTPGTSEVKAPFLPMSASRRPGLVTILVSKAGAPQELASTWAVV